MRLYAACYVKGIRLRIRNQRSCVFKNALRPLLHLQNEACTARLRQTAGLPVPKEDNEDVLAQTHLQLEKVKLAFKVKQEEEEQSKKEITLLKKQLQKAQLGGDEKREDGEQSTRTTTMFSSTGSNSLEPQYDQIVDETPEEVAMSDVYAELGFSILETVDLQKHQESVKSLVDLLDQNTLTTYIADSAKVVLQNIGELKRRARRVEYRGNPIEERKKRKARRARQRAKAVKAQAEERRRRQEEEEKEKDTMQH